MLWFFEIYLFSHLQIQYNVEKKEGVVCNFVLLTAFRLGGKDYRRRKGKGIGMKTRKLGIFNQLYILLSIFFIHLSKIVSPTNARYLRAG